MGAVIVAAGRGERAGGDRPKQFQPLAGVPVLLRAIRPFASHPDIAHVVVVLPPDQAARPPEWLTPHLGDRLTVAAGGDRRMDSVERGLAALPASVEGVLVHDGARPFPDPGVIDSVIAEVRAGRSAIAARPVTDTLKEADAAGADGPPSVARTVPRERLWRAQTPQGFPRRDLEAGIRGARERGDSPTDDAALLEALGIPVRLIPDVARNLKLTTADDFAVARALLAEPA
ncbi:MAG: 2-C-methyl-D-erythritol 4-phosphate cytidylyltransferase [Gemmatimonadales bacterium]